MTLRFNKKIIAACVALSLVAPLFANAQLGGLGSFVGSPTYITNDPLSVKDDQVTKALIGKSGSILGGIFGNSFDSAVDQFNGALNKIQSASCITSDITKILNAANQVDKWTFGGLNLLTSSGENAWTFQLQGQITQLTATSNCLSTQIDAVKAQNPSSILQAQQKQTMLDDLTKQKTTIDARLDYLRSQFKVASQSLWKTIMVKILISTTRAVTQKLISDLTNKYRIQDFQQYADAVASQVYTAQLIRANAPDKADQLIVRSMIANPLARNAINSGIYSRAADALSYNGELYKPGTMDPSDPHFYEKMAQIGAPEASAPYLQSVYQQNANEIQAQALANAKAEIAVSSGLKAPRNCTNAISQQQAIDQQYIAVSTQVQNRGDLLDSLKTAKKLGKPVSDDDIKKAQADFDAADKQLQGLPDKYDNVALDICKEIVSPANQIDKVINQLLEHYGQSMSNYNDNNLPIFANLISDIGSKLTTSLIFGKDINASVITTSKGFDQALPAAANYLQYLHDESQVNGVILNWNDNGSNADGSEAFNIDWDATAITGATSVSIEVSPPPFKQDGTLAVGNPINGQKINSIDGSLNLNLYKAGQYTITLKVYKGAAVAATVTSKKPINYQPAAGSGSSNASSASSGSGTVTVTPPSNQTMKVGDTLTLTATVVGSSGQVVPVANNVSVATDDPSVVSVKSTSGKTFTIQAKATGSVMLTITWEDPVTGQEYSSQPFMVTVMDAGNGISKNNSGQVAGAKVIQGISPRGK